MKVIMLLVILLEVMSVVELCHFWIIWITLLWKLDVFLF